MDLDFLAADQAIDILKKKLSSINHSEREKIADDIIIAVDKICKEN